MGLGMWADPEGGQSALSEGRWWLTAGRLVHEGDQSSSSLKSEHYETKRISYHFDSEAKNGRGEGGLVLASMQGDDTTPVMETLHWHRTVVPSCPCIRRPPQEGAGC